MENNDGIIIDNPSTWPINSEKARQLRRSFVQEGFRRLYSVASGQMHIIGASDGIQNNNENEDNDGLRDGEAEPNNAINENETPLAIPVDDREDWVYYAQ